MARSATGPRPFLLAAVGLVVGAVAAAGLAATGWPGRRHARPSHVIAPDAAQPFLDAWRRSRTGTWAVDGRFERVTSAGKRLAAAIHLAQRPPDRLVTGLGSIAARRGERRLACSPSEDGALHCRDGGPAPPYEQEVAEDLRVLATYVIGQGALYNVRADNGCFALRLRARYLTPPYGDRARFCFDGPTGAPVRSEIQRPEARDLTVADQVRAQPTEADLDPERWGGGGRG
jgi:hypothetical protein